MKKSFFNPWRISVICVFAFSILLYLPSLNGGSLWDDSELISGSGIGGGTLVGAFTQPFLHKYFRPLTSVSVLADTAYAKYTPFYYHQTNIILHALTAALVCCLAFLLTGRKRAGILSGFFFAAQPMQVGAAAWIGGRTDVLSCLFLTLFLVCLVSYYRSNKVSWLAGSVIAYLLAALSKEQAIAIFPIIPISVFVFGSRKWRDALRFSAPFLVATVAYFVTWRLLVPFPKPSPFEPLNDFLVAIRTVALYGLAFLIPNNPSVETYTLDNFQGPIWLLTGALLIVGFVLLIRGLWKNHRPVAWILLAGLLVYIPVCNFPPVPAMLVAPYRVAESGIGIACGLGIAAAYFLTSKRYALASLLGANFIAGVIVSWFGIHMWLNAKGLFEKLTKNDPHFMIGVANYAHFLDADGQPEEAYKWSTSLLVWLFGGEDWAKNIESNKLGAITPFVMQRLGTNIGDPHISDIGSFMGGYAATLSNLKRTDDARLGISDAVTISPDDARLRNSYGNFFIDVDRKQAIQAWETAIKISPSFTAARLSLAHERVKDKRFADAIQLISPVIHSQNWNTFAWIDLADAEIGVGDTDAAETALQNAEHGFFPAKSQISARRRQIEALRGSKKGG